MSPESQRIAIAEACGWHSFKDIGGDGETRLWGMSRGMKQTSLPTELVPDYLSDLNAIAEAVRTLTEEQAIAYFEALLHILWRPEPKLIEKPSGGWWKITTCEARMVVGAKAAQCAEAFLRATNRWQETKP